MKREARTRAHGLVATAFVAVTLVQCQDRATQAPGPSASPARATPTSPAAAPGAAPGPAVGATLPAFEAPDQDGRPQKFETLRGPNGLLLNFNRSVVW